MSAPTSDKLQKLHRMLERDPRDAFLLYAIGMEHKKLQSPALAIEYFDRTIEVDAGYCYAYFQRGQVHEQAGNLPAARDSYRAGIAAAERAGDAHAKSELEAALDMIADG
jgi:tetratricopeptide (TPR) repeat protein